MSPQAFKVLIIGGGPCGLALAQGLKLSGIPYTLFERDSITDYHTRPRDWGSLLHWAQPYLQKCLPPDLWERRKEMYVDPFHDWQNSSPSLVWHGKTGEVIWRPEAAFTVRVSRRKVRELLVQGLDVQYSKRLSQITMDGANSVTVHFEDGTSATGSLLVGCDGGKSRVREYIVGTEAARGFDADYTMINTWTTVPAETALALRAKHPIVSLATYPELGITALIALLDKPQINTPPEQWKFQIYTGWKGAPRKADMATPAAAMQHFQAQFQVLAEPFHSAGLSLPPDHVLPVDDGWNFRPNGDFEWNNHNGRVTLAGDAAHSMLPHRGQGLNNAIMDAAELLDAIRKFVGSGGGSESEPLLLPRDAIQAYEDEMRPRGSAEVDLTLQTMRASSVEDLPKNPISTLGFNRPPPAAS